MSIRCTDQDSFGRTTGALVSSATGFSALIFVKRVVDTNNFATIMHMDDGTANFQFQVQGNGDTVGLFSSAGGNFNTGVDLVNNVWFACAMSCDSSQGVTLYAKRLDNNGWDGTASDTSAIANTTYDRLEFGNSITFNGEDFNGAFAGAKIWTTELTSDELLLEAQRLRPVRYADLNSFYPMFPGSTEHFRDHGPTGVTLELFDHITTSTFTDEEQPPVPWGGLVPIIQPAATGGTTVNIDQASETDTALSITPSKVVAVDQAVETDSALDITPARALAVDQATETDTALDITPSKTVDVDQALETDTALDITVGAVGGVAVDIAVETDTALDITPVKVVQVDQAIETDTALDVTIGRVIGVDQAIETDTALDVQPARGVNIDIAVETDTALPLVQSIVVPIDIAIETDTALPLVQPVQAGARKKAGGGALAAKLLALELDLQEARKRDAPPVQVAELQAQRVEIATQMQQEQASNQAPPQAPIDEEEELAILMAIDDLL